MALCAALVPKTWECWVANVKQEMRLEIEMDHTIPERVAERELRDAEANSSFPFLYIFQHKTWGEDSVCTCDAASALREAEQCCMLPPPLRRAGAQTMDALFEPTLAAYRCIE